MRIGEIWLVDLEDSKGHERQGTRPAVIVGIAHSMIIVVPLTGNLNSSKQFQTRSNRKFKQVSGGSGS
jgi:mRNA-degrading endonuclease toxin of MazEF toxin-antitoxin module